MWVIDNKCEIRDDKCEIKDVGLDIKDDGLRMRFFLKIIDERWEEIDWWKWIYLLKVKFADLRSPFAWVFFSTTIK